MSHGLPPKVKGSVMEELAPQRHSLKSSAKNLTVPSGRIHMGFSCMEQDPDQTAHPLGHSLPSLEHEG